MHDPVTPSVSVLVVEDDPAVAELIRSVLNDVEGWGVAVAHDAAEARSVFRQVRINVLVLDINLPGISGLELLELLRQDEGWAEPPVIIVSATADEPGVRAALRDARVTRTLKKPFDLDELIASIKDAIRA